MYYWKTFILLFQFSFVACEPLSKSREYREGVVVNKYCYLDPIRKIYVCDDTYTPDKKIYFRDSVAIEEIKYLYITDSMGYQKRRAEIDHYTYIDIRTKMFYDYSSFSDTARVLKKYTQDDSVGVFSGWNFYYYHDIPRSEPVESLTDTVIDGKSLNRYLFIRKRQEGGAMLSDSFIVYLDCQRKVSLVQIDKRFAEEKGCTVVRRDNFYDGPPNAFSRTSAQLIFLSDKLTPLENKIFDVWEKYAKENPVFR